MAQKYTTDPILVGEGKLSFVYAFERAKDQRTGKETKYETALLLPPGYDTKPLLDMMWEAWFLRFGKDQAKWPKGNRLNPVRMPEDVIRPCEERSKYAGYLPGWKFFGARSDYSPKVRDRTRAKVFEADGVARFPLVTPEETALVYPGRWAHLSVNAFTYQNESTGVSLGLEGILLGRNDTRLAGGGSRADTTFDQVAEEMVEDPMG